MADGIPYQITQATLSISDSSSYPNDGVCIDHLSLQLDGLDYNDVLIDEETWLDGNCEPADRTCPCTGYPVENVEYICQVWRGVSTVEMSVGQYAWVADIPVGVVDVVISLDAISAYDLYAILPPDDYQVGSGFEYDFKQVATDSQSYLLVCLAGTDCVNPNNVDGMTINYIPIDETSSRIEIDSTADNVVIYASGRQVSGSATVTYSYDGTEMCSAELKCEPCPSYECKDDLDGTPRFSVCNGVDLPFCEAESVAFDLNRQCDDVSPNDTCDVSFELNPEPCRDCYTDTPSSSPSTTTSEPTTSPVVSPSEAPSVPQPRNVTAAPTPYEACTCRKWDYVTLNLTTCDTPVSASSLDHITTVTVCDAADICNEFPLPTSSFGLGETFVQTYDNLVANSYKPYEDYFTTATINSISEDGFCIKEWYINGYPLPKNVDLSDSFWVDGDCSGHINSCDCGYYPTGSIQYSCDAFTGSSSLRLSVLAETDIANIPQDVVDLEITLTADVDLDLQLYDGDVCIAGYECANIDGLFTYEGMSMEYTGDERTGPVTEVLTIDRTTKELILRVKSYGNGEGTVTYSWSGMDPCPSERVGCNECSTYGGCKDDLVPVCDGSAEVTCVAAEDRDDEQAKCDDYNPEDFFSDAQIADLTCGTINVEFPDCNTCYPTVSPSVTPTVLPSDVPSVIPTKSPSVSPTTQPTTDSPSNHPIFSDPTTSPTTDTPTENPSTSPSKKPSYQPPTKQPTFQPPTGTPTTSPTSTPTTSPTDSPSTSPTTSPTWCPYICVWDCTTADQCVDECNVNVTSAVTAANENCEADLFDLKARVETAESEVDTLQSTCTSCTDLDNNVATLASILADSEVANWQAVVDSGLSCSFVSTTFCGRVTGCALSGSDCIDITSGRRKLQTDDCSNHLPQWTAAVSSNAVNCQFVPIDMCSQIVQCAVSQDGSTCESRESQS
jgi:hypothetical protein